MADEEDGTDSDEHETWRQIVNAIEIVNAIQNESDSANLSKLVSALCAEIDRQRTLPAGAANRIPTETVSENKNAHSSTKDRNDQLA